jgi:thymidylate kinase
MLYLNTKTEICLDRIGNRNRRGENKITEEQLERCETYHQIMFEGTGINLKTIDMDHELNGAVKDLVDIVIRWCQQVIRREDSSVSQMGTINTVDGENL